MQIHSKEKIVDEKYVSYPKSLYTVLDTLKIMTKKDDIILDNEKIDKESKNKKKN